MFPNNAHRISPAIAVYTVAVVAGLYGSTPAGRARPAFGGAPDAQAHLAVPAIHARAESFDRAERWRETLRRFGYEPAVIYAFAAAH